MEEQHTDKHKQTMTNTQRYKNTHTQPGEVAARRRELHWQRSGGEDKEWKNKNTNTQTHNSEDS